MEHPHFCVLINSRDNLRIMKEGGVTFMLGIMLLIIVFIIAMITVVCNVPAYSRLPFCFVADPVLSIFRLLLGG